MINFQGMTDLPEATERKLCSLTTGNLLALLNEKRSKARNGASPSILGASDAYTLIQEIARRWPAAELATELAQRYTFDPSAQPVAIEPAAPAPAPVPKAAPVAAPRQRVAPAGKPTCVALTAGGTTKLQPDSKRSQIVAIMKAFNGQVLIEDLDAHFGEPTMPHLKKLMEAGWVTFC